MVAFGGSAAAAGSGFAAVRGRGAPAAGDGVADDEGDAAARAAGGAAGDWGGALPGAAGVSADGDKVLAVPAGVAGSAPTAAGTADAAPALAGAGGAAIAVAGTPLSVRSAVDIQPMAARAARASTAAIQMACGFRAALPP